jgi:hypothetical protein
MTAALLDGEGRSTANYWYGVATGYYILGTTKVRSGAFEGVSAGQVGCTSPLVGEVALHPLDGIIRQVVGIE